MTFIAQEIGSEILCLEVRTHEQRLCTLAVIKTNENASLHYVVDLHDHNHPANRVRSLMFFQ